MRVSESEARAVREWVRGVLRGIYRPLPEEEIWEWAERTLRIPASENEELAGTLWSSSWSPYVRELMEWVKRPGKGEFWIKKSSQVGFTMAVLIIICWMMVHRPGNVGYSIDSIGEARNISRARLKRWIEENRLLDVVEGKADDLSNLTYFLRGMTVYLMGAHSAGAYRNKSLVLAVLDELDAHEFMEGEGTTPDLMRERLKRPKDAKLIGFSTPGKNGLIGQEYEAGTQEEIRLPCPHCTMKNALEWKNLVYSTPEFKDTTGELVEELVRANAYFVCPSCGGRIEEKHKAAMLQGYEFVARNPKAGGNRRSVHIWDAYSMFRTWGSIAWEWVEARGRPTKTQRFMQGTRAEYYQETSGELAANDVLSKKGPYKRGECPVGLDFLGCTTDIQGDLVKALKFGVTLSGELYVLDWRRMHTLEDVEDFADVPVVVRGEERVVQCGLIDEGYRRRDVRRFCYHREPRFYPLKGTEAAVTRDPVKPGWYQVELEEGFDEILVYHVSHDEFMWQVRRLLRPRRVSPSKEKEQPEEVHDAPPIKRVWFPQDVDEDEAFVEELVAEYPKRVKNRFGAEVLKWHKKGPNDFGDCLKYACALWAVVGPALRGEQAAGLEQAVAET